jgi:hypothetical protein
MQCTKILSPLNKETYTPNLCNIATQIFNKLISMGISLNITIDDFFTYLQIDEIIYSFAL